RPDDHRLFDDSLSDYLEIRQPGRAEPLELGLQSRTALHHTAVREQRELLAPELHPVELADAHLVPVYPALRIARYRKVLPRFVAELRSVGVRRDTVGDQHTLGPSPKLVRELIEKRRQGIPDAANPEHLVEALLVRVLRNDTPDAPSSRHRILERRVIDRVSVALCLDVPDQARNRLRNSYLRAVVHRPHLAGRVHHALVADHLINSPGDSVVRVARSTLAPHLGVAVPLRS